VDGERVEKRAGHVMMESTRTTTSLLEGLADLKDREAWVSFDARYRPLLLAVCARLGLSDADAADVAQDTIARFLVSYRAGQYDRSRGRLRTWLASIARCRISDLRRSRSRRRVLRGESAIMVMPDESSIVQLWDEEQSRLLLTQAWEIVRAGSRCSKTTLESFELICFRNLTPAQVAEQLEISVQDVYRSKHRVAALVRDAVAKLEAAVGVDE